MEVYEANSGFLALGSSLLAPEPTWAEQAPARLAWRQPWHIRASKCGGGRGGAGPIRDLGQCCGSSRSFGSGTRPGWARLDIQDLNDKGSEGPPVTLRCTHQPDCQSM